MTSLVSIDSGSSYMKACSAVGPDTVQGTCLRIPAVVQRLQKRLLYDGPDALRVDGVEYLVGDGALSVMSDPAAPHDGHGYHGSLEQRIQVCHALGRLGALGEAPMLFLSLPYTLHKDEATRQRCWQAMRHLAWQDRRGEHEVHFADVAFVPQGVGALRAYQAQVEGDPPRVACMVDIGSRTTDVVTVRHQDGRDTYALQACASLTDLNTTAFFAGWFDAACDEFDLGDRQACYYTLMGEAAQGRFNLSHYGKPCDLSAAFSVACTNFCATLKTQVERVVGALWPAVEAVILTGGGAMLVAKPAESTWGDSRVVVLPDTANASGQLVWAKARQMVASGEA